MKDSKPTVENIDEHYVKCLFESCDYERYSCYIKSYIKLPASYIKLAYLLEKHLANPQQYANADVLNKLLVAIEDLIDECDDLSRKIPVFSSSRMSLFVLVIYTARISIKGNQEHQLCKLKLIEKIKLKSPLLYKGYDFVAPKWLWKSAVQANDLETIKVLLSLVDEKTRHKMFKLAFFLTNITIIRMIIECDKGINHNRSKDWLKKIGAWPLNELKLSQSDVSTADSDHVEQDMKTLTEALASKFPLDNDESIFSNLFPFSNEGRSYKSILKILNSIDILKKANAIAHLPTNKMGVAIVFGESNLFSILTGLSPFIQLVLIADVEPRQYKHMRHMLDCLNASKSPEEFIRQYKTNNPIRNNYVGGTKILADLKYLTYCVQGGVNSSSHHFLSSLERFKKCKEAATKLVFVQIKLDLMNADKCTELSSLLEQYNATIRFCNFTNIHDYDKDDRLYKSIPLLIHSAPECLVMFATGPLNSLRSNITQGLEAYFSTCLKRAYPQVPDVNLENFKDKVVFEINPAIGNKDLLHGNGIFSLTYNQQQRSTLEENVNPQQFHFNQI